MRKALRHFYEHVGEAPSIDKLVWIQAQAQQTRRIGDRERTQWPSRATRRGRPARESLHRCRQIRTTLQICL